jgi:hypothetical protein
VLEKVEIKIFKRDIQKDTRSARKSLITKRECVFVSSTKQKGQNLFENNKESVCVVSFKFNIQQHQAICLKGF